MTEQIQANMAGILVTSIEGPKAFPIFVKKTSTLRWTFCNCAGLQNGKRKRKQSGTGQMAWDDCLLSRLHEWVSEWVSEWASEWACEWVGALIIVAESYMPRQQWSCTLLYWPGWHKRDEMVHRFIRVSLEAILDKHRGKLHHLYHQPLQLKTNNSEFKLHVHDNCQFWGISSTGIYIMRVMRKYH